MITRITDLRVIQAQRFGAIVGLPCGDAHRIAMIADLLTATYEWRDLTFMFPGLSHHAGPLWSVPVDARWAMAFQWMEDFGPFDIHLL